MELQPTPFAGIAQVRELGDRLRVSRDAGGAYRFTYHWSEFIDLDSGDWWRTSHREIRKFGPEGRLSVTNRGAGTDYHWQMGSRLYVTDPMISTGHRR